LRAICKATEVVPGAVKRVEVEGLPPLAVYNLGGRFYVTDDTCTHGKASLAEGIVEGTSIECPWPFRHRHGPADVPARDRGDRHVSGHGRGRRDLHRRMTT
jgi:nitrite reductase/ring-hydroxylating ferredoxin subunit